MKKQTMFILVTLVLIGIAVALNLWLQWNISNPDGTPLQDYNSDLARSRSEPMPRLPLVDDAVVDVSTQRVISVTPCALSPLANELEK